MIRSIRIENFRCFKKLELADFSKFNVIVGDNGSGKTALIEALFLPGNDPGMPFVFRRLRGMLAPKFSPEKGVYESMYNDLFFGFSADSSVTIDLEGSPENARKAKLSFVSTPELPLFPDDKSKNGKSTDKLFTFQTKDTDNNTYTATLNLNGNLAVSGGCKAQQSALSASSGLPNAEEVAQRFSNLKRHNDREYKLMIETIYKLFPQITDLDLFITGDLPEILCRVAGISKPMPVSLASSGLSKILSTLLLFPITRNGILLLDEIENGIYYKRYGELWEALIKFSEIFNTQLFVATHSKECLEALDAYPGKDNSDFRLIRTERGDDGVNTAKIFKGENMFAALETGTEVR